MTESPLKEARLAEKTFRLMFDTETARRWQAESANYRAAVDRAVWAMRSAGISVSQIAVDYGTKNRNTIYDILGRMETFISSSAPDSTSWLKVERNLKAQEREGTPNAWTATVQAWDDFRRPDALSALAKTGSDVYSGWLTFYVRPNDSIYIIDAEHSGSPLHKEIIAWQDDSPLVQQIKTQMKEATE